MIGYAIGLQYNILTLTRKGVSMATTQAAPSHPQYVWWNGEIVE